MTKQTGEFVAPKALRDRFGGLYAMQNFRGIDETPSSKYLQVNLSVNYQPIEMESALLMEMLSLVKYIYVKTQEASQNSNLDMREFLGINKAWQSIQGKLVNITSKLK